MKIESFQQFCANHADRAASARCVRCQRSICQECSTQWEGINYCVRCLAERSSAVAVKGTLSGWIGGTAGIVVLFWLVAKTLLWIATLVAALT